MNNTVLPESFKEKDKDVYSGCLLGVGKFFSIFLLVQDLYALSQYFSV